MKIGKIRDNYGTPVNIIENLKVGDKLLAKKNVKSTGDIGMSGHTFKYDAFITGKVYEVSQITNWDFKSVAYVSDEDGTLHFATPELFDSIEFI